MGQLGIGNDELRHRVSECAKNFKTSWIEMGRFLYTVYKDKHYRNWGFREFEIYCLKEIGIKTLTAQKLLRSYHFLEKEEPTYVEKSRYAEKDASKVPDYESVNVLRLAKNRKIDEKDYSELRHKVLEEARPAQAVRQSYRQLIEAGNEESEEELETRKRKTLLRRYISNLNSLKDEVETNDFLSKTKALEVRKLIGQLEEIMNESLG